jgi:hypothetical protein
MFQYAAGKALAERHCVGLVLDLSGFRTYPFRSFLLDRLLVPEAIAAAEAEAASDMADSNLSRISTKWKGRIDRLLARAGLPKLLRSPHDYSEPHFHYDPGYEALGPLTSLCGYFQSERYFNSIAENLRGWFSPREPLQGNAAKMLDRIEASRMPVSVHVRRGDYLNAGTAEFHGIVEEHYYRNAIASLEKVIGGETELFIFSDDPSAAESVLNFVPRSRLVHVRGEPDRPWEDMALMARCRHHVIANSSFSWWGAWLNSSPDKQVIAPLAWFGTAQLRKTMMADLYPSGWILV